MPGLFPGMGRPAGRATIANPFVNMSPPVATPATPAKPTPGVTPAGASEAPVGGGANAMVTGGAGPVKADPLVQPALANTSLVGGHGVGSTFASMAPAGAAQPVAPVGARPAGGTYTGGSKRPGFGAAPVGGSTARIRAQRAAREAGGHGAG